MCLHLRPELDAGRPGPAGVVHEFAAFLTQQVVLEIAEQVERSKLMVLLHSSSLLV